MDGAVSVRPGGRTILAMSSFLLLIAGFGCTSGCLADVTGDRVVNTDDILVVVGA